MAVTEIKEFREEELDELAKFLYDNGFDHPELGNRDLLLWTEGYRFLSRSKGEIAGYLAQITQVFKYGDKSKQDGIENWSVTLVLKDFGDSPDAARKRTAFTHELLLKVENNPPWQFAAVGVVPEIEEFYKIRGHNVRRDCLKMYARFLKPLKMLGYIGKSGYLSLPIFIGNMALKPGRKISNGKIEKISKFDPSWDNRWDSILRGRYELYGSRNAEFLNYKLSQPNKKYHVYLRHNDGYIIFRQAKHFTKDLHIVKICDLVGTVEAKIDLINVAIKYARDIDAYGVVALSSYADESLFKKAGLYISNNYVVTLPPKITAKIHVTFFDADLDNLW
jgi:hypothetical protein